MVLSSDQYPLLVTGSPLAAAMLGVPTIARGGTAVLRALDSPAPSSIGRVVVVDPIRQLRERFPTRVLEAPPLGQPLEKALYDHFNLFSLALVRQTAVADQACLDADGSCVVLVVVDGLSYFDLPAEVDAIPCLVDGPTITSLGFQRVVGSPSLAHRLFHKGYRRFLGFSYWEPDDNEVAARFFAGVGQVTKVRSYDEVLTRLRRSNLRRTYVQVALAGLDQYAHNNRDTPLIGPEVDRILTRIRLLTELFLERGVSARLVVTADHGILWRETAALVQLNRSYSGLFSRRYANRSVATGSTGRLFNTEMGPYTCLRYPYVSGALRSTEWGVHGGISCRESIVPLWFKRVG